MSEKPKTFNLVLTSTLFRLDYVLKQEIINLKNFGVDFEVIRRAPRLNDGSGHITTVVLLTNNITDYTLLKLLTINNKILRPI